MSTQDRPPSDASVSRAEERDRLLAEVVAHTEAQEIHYRAWIGESRRRGIWKPVTALVLFFAAALTATVQLRAGDGGAPAALTPQDLEQGMRAALYLQAQQIEAFRLLEGRLPRQLDELEGRLAGVVYVPSTRNTYQLVVGSAGSGTLVYDSGRPTEAFRQAAPWSLRRGAVR